MYWPYSTPSLFQAPADGARPVGSFAFSRTAELMLTLSADQLELYNTKPAVLLSRVRRTAAGLAQDGTFERAWFSWDSRAVFVLTSKHTLLHYVLNPAPAPYEYAPQSMRHIDTFAPGPGEGAYLPGWELQFQSATHIPGAHSLVVRPDGLTLLLLFPHPALLHLPLPPFPLDLPDPHKLAISAEALSLDPAELPVEFASSAADAAASDSDLVWSRALGVYCLVLPGGGCFALSPPQDAADAHARADSIGGSTLSLPRGSVSLPRSPGGEASAAASWDVRELGLWEEQRGGVGKRKREKGRAVKASLSGRLAVLAVGSSSGAVHLFSIPTLQPHTAAPLVLPTAAQNHRLLPGPVLSLAWTPDGAALAVGWEKGWGVWSSGGRLLGWGMREDGQAQDAVDEDWLDGVRGVGWVGGGLELVLLSRPTSRLYIQPFAKSSFTTLPTPSATLYPLLLTSASLLLSPIASLPSSTYLSTLHSLPSSFVTIPLPPSYVPYQYPLRYATVSDDGKLVAVAGRRGFATWSRGSGRWKVFEREEDEEAFRVRGGMCWFLHVLVVGVEEDGKHFLRLYSRDDTLSATSHLSSIPLTAPIHLISLHDNSLLLYTTANTFYHFLIVPTEREVELRLCGSISFEGVVQVPGRVRAMSWLIPLAQKKLGNPADDLPLATVIFLIDSALVLLRPRKASPHHPHRRTNSLRPDSPASPSHKRTLSLRPAEPEEVKYDFQVLADRVESYWTHLSGIGTLENSLWAWDGERLRVWLDALTVDRVETGAAKGEEKGYKRVGESVSIPLDFYPLSVLMDKGIIVGVESELSIRRSLPFGTHKVLTATHLFLPHLLRFHLSRGQIKAAVLFAAHFQHLSYFAHALEILLHGVLEQEADEGPAPSPQVVDGLEWRKPLSDLSPMSPSFKTDQGLRADDDADDTTPAPDQWKGVGVLPLVVEFLDHFPQALDVVVGCARKTEVARWDFLFDVVGNPRDLFEVCLKTGQLKTATSYLLVLHTLERLSSPSTDTLRVLRQAIESHEWDLCKDLLRFLHSVDEDGRELATVVRELGVFEQSDLDGMLEGTTADSTPFSLDDPLVAAPVRSDRSSPSTPPSPGQVLASPPPPPSSPSPSPLPPPTEVDRSPLQPTTPSSSPVTGLSSLLFGSALGSPSAPASIPGQGRVFSRPTGPTTSPSPSPAKGSPKPRAGGGRWV